MRLIFVSIENFKIAVNAMRSNVLRTTLTILIIAIGIMALVGILTAVDAIKNTINTQFANMGANSFSISKKRFEVHGTKSDKRQTAIKNVTYQEASEFKSSFSFPARVSLYTDATGTATLISEYEKTNPNISVIGADEEYIQNSGYEIGLGRNFTSSEVYSGAHVVILGGAVVKTLFKYHTSPVESFINIGGRKYLVIGVINEKGTSMGGGGDNFCVLPINNVRQYFSSYPLSYNINVQLSETDDIDEAISEAEGLFRRIRKLSSFDENDFSISKSDSLANMLFDNIAVVTMGATLIGLITLLGATIGLMNIMLVSVSERTREIGIRKAIGAPAKTIKHQFLFESIVIGQCGGLLGIILGIIAGNIVSSVTGGSFIIPWMWIGFGVVLCLFVGIISGYLPAVKASKLDPIIALHHE